MSLVDGAEPPRGMLSLVIHDWTRIVARRARGLVVLPLLLGVACGGARAPVATATPTSRAAPPERVLLRLRPRVGAEYRFDSRMGMTLMGRPLQTVAHGALTVDGLGAVPTSYLLTSRILSLAVLDASGQPTSTPLPFDATRVVTHRTVDDTGHGIGAVTIEGAPPPWDETFRTAAESCTAHWPTHAVGIGDHWEDPSDLHIAFAGMDTTFHCRADSVLDALTGEGDARTAIVLTDAHCASDTLTLGTGQGATAQRMAMDLETHTRAEVSVADALHWSAHSTSLTRVYVVGAPDRAQGVPERTLAAEVPQTLDMSVERASD